MTFKLISLLFLSLGFFFCRGYTDEDQCNENEEYFECGSGCPLTCENYRKPLFCTKNCKQGCLCKHGYVIGPDKKCILPDQCPIESRCSKNEHYVDCVNSCNDCWTKGDCEEDDYCEPGCDCKPGYFRDDDGECIPEYECTSQGKGCGVNEVYSYCANPCNDCEQKGDCEYDCHYGCDCKKGYHRNEKGICVLASKCHAMECGLYEEYKECGSACPPSCDNLNKSVTCTQTCVAGCFCTNGYVRGPNGKCIKPNECPVVCGLYEEYSECGSSCGHTCKNLGKSIMCTQQCVKGCFCVNGYVRSDAGKCVKPNECPTDPGIGSRCKDCKLDCPDDQEYYDCIPTCNTTCENYKPGTQGTDLCTTECQPGCFCKGELVKNKNDQCIHPNECPIICGEFEEFSECGSACQPNCTNLGKSIACTQHCVRGCFCIKGYVRNPDGKCVKPNHCPVVCNENEEYQNCGTPCPKTCSNYGKTMKCGDFCVKGCFCKPGFVRNTEGKCILPTECPKVCGINEVYEKCGTACPETCTNYTNTEECSEKCVEGCFCEPGCVRGPNWKCMRPEKCPIVCEEDEIFEECGNACEHTCSNLTISRFSCPLPCKRGCFCRPGYVRGLDGKCIKKTSCPQICKENEEYKECGSLCAPTCDRTDESKSCPSKCIKGCFCKDGYVKGPDGNCISPELCPPVCKENEEYKECGSLCVPTCDKTDESKSCPSKCIKGCFCKDGYVKGPDGNCISPELCPPVCEENEEFQDCGSACPPTCLNKTPICDKSCVKGCFCKPRYIIGPAGKCILPRNCPQQCKENEVFMKCGPRCEATCSTKHKKRVPCPSCKKGCFCKPGYVRGPRRECILPTACPPVCKENEAYIECGSPCPATCDDRNPICIKMCVKGCFCKAGYVKNREGKCIRPLFCPEKCKENEEFKECGSACPDTCSNRSQICKDECIVGCFCLPGFVKGPDGDCILPINCPVVCDKNEEFKECGSACPPTCRNRSRSCSGRCNKGCFCKPGYIKDPTGKCVLPQECPIECPENEVYRKCGTHCPITCGLQGRSISCKLQCVKGCFCKDGLIRGPGKKCIKPELCPKMCGRNEVYKKCSKPCEHTCKNYNKELSCPGPCISGCFCKPGFVRGQKRRCVPKNSCIKSCKINEERKCSHPSCEGSCEDILLSNRPCPVKCTTGCYCKKDYVRNPDKLCVLPTMCPRKCLLFGGTCPDGIESRGKENGLEKNETVTTSSPANETATTSSLANVTITHLITTANIVTTTPIQATVPDLTALDGKETFINETKIKTTLPTTMGLSTAITNNTIQETTQFLTTKSQTDFARDVTKSPNDIPANLTKSPTDIAEDLTKSSIDIAGDFTKSPTDIPVNLTKSPTDIAEDLTKSPTDTAGDFTKSPTDIPVNLTKSPTDFAGNLTKSPTDIAEDFTKSPTDISENSTKSAIDITENLTETLLDNSENLTKLPIEISKNVMTPVTIEPNILLTTTSQNISINTENPTKKTVESKNT